MLGPWAQIFTGIDLGSMVCIGILAFILARAGSMSDNREVLIPTALGLIYGVLDAWSKLTDGWLWAPSIMLAFKGLLLNGAGATMVGRITATMLEKWWPSTGGALKAAATEQASAIVEHAAATGQDVKVVAKQAIVTGAAANLTPPTPPTEGG